MLIHKLCKIYVGRPIYLYPSRSRIEVFRAGCWELYALHEDVTWWKKQRMWKRAVYHLLHGYTYKQTTILHHPFTSILQSSCVGHYDSIAHDCIPWTCVPTRAMLLVQFNALVMNIQREQGDRKSIPNILRKYAGTSRKDFVIYGYILWRGRVWPTIAPDSFHGSMLEWCS